MEEAFRARGEAEAELERIIGRMQELQRAIATTGQPASFLQLEELRELGREYARIVERLGTLPQESSQA